MKKRFTTFAALLATFALTFAVAGCAPQENTGSDATGDAAAESLYAQHQDRGTPIDDLTEVSIATCTGSGCHGGDWESLVEENEAMWAGIGQIVDANPHASHASNAYECSDCHSLTEAQTNQCNQCHVFESPESWVDPDKTTTPYGPGNTEPMF